MPFRLGLLTLFLSLLAVPATASAAPTDPQEAQAKAALATVRSTLRGVGGADPTLALRDLVLLRGSLPEDARAEADRYLARPTDGPGDRFGDGYAVGEETPECSDVVCVHYVRSTEDRPSLVDDDHDGVPDFVTRALDTLTHVHETYVGAGYRAPKPDGTRGGDARVDVYLKDIGRQGIYGYCTSDAKVGARRDAWAYCVLDNDYSAAEFPRHTPIENLQVTAAHEYFHAVQFGYDIGEDGWFMEATATWAEDELYDDINDNRQYLTSGPMRHPDASLDQFRGLFQYGSWIFFRYLTETFRASDNAMPTLVRDMWRRADDAPGGADDYSLLAVRKELSKRGLSLTDAFAGFAQANRMPGRSYDEGTAQRYPSAPLDRTVRLATTRRTAPTYDVRLDHLTSSTVSYVPTKSLRGQGWVLRLHLDLPQRFRGSGAVVTVIKRGARPSVRRVPLNTSGNATLSARFGRATVKRVEVTLANAGDDFACRRHTAFSCAGVSRDDGRRALLDVRLRRR
ncbi:hypothetical protein BH11ACT8_BH11ACT8_01480 [soil metagenome]